MTTPSSTHPVSTTSQFALTAVSKSYGDTRVLQAVSFTLRPGERVGVVGDNGSGKSTLLRLLAGREEPDDGEVRVVAPGGTGHLPQAIGLPPDATVADAVDDGLADLRAMEAELRLLEGRLADDPDAPAAYAALTARFEARGGYEADTRVDIALHALGLPRLDRTRRLGTLSGGERSRLALAVVLAAQPELLLLDEPTNDLDDRAVAWLEGHLRAYRGTVVAVTHDRVFLERITDVVWDVEAGGVRRYGDGWSGYLAAKAAERRRRLRAYEKWRAELERSRRLAEAGAARMAAVPRKAPLAVFGHGAFRARGRVHGATARIRQAKERVARLTAQPVTPPPEPLRLTARPVTDAGTDRADGGGDGPAAELTDVRVEGRLDVPSLRVTPGDRVLVTGPNGAGKTTLLRVIAGELAPDDGEVRVHARVGRLRQEETPWPPEATVLGAFAAGRGYADRDEAAGRLLSLGLLRPDDLGRRLVTCSYGQRRRVELARLVSEPVGLLLLDEPTNHLSPGLVEDLEEALTGYGGALVVVTHDRRLRSRFPARRLVMAEGRIVS